MSGDGAGPTPGDVERAKMHELSIAESLRDLVRQHVPDRTTVKSIFVRIGPKRCIVSEALKWGWMACTDGSELQGVRLDLDMLPWRLTCPDCQRQWQSDDMFEACTCGCDTPFADGSDELSLISLEVEDEPGDQVSDESTRS